MIKKIFFAIIIFVSIFSFFDFSYSACDLGGDVGSSLEGCLGDATVIQSSDMKVESGFKLLIVSFVNKISTILAVLAVGSIAYGSMVIVTSVGADDKITKGRNIIKWSLVGFLILVSAAGLIKLIIYVMYGLG